MTVWIAPPSEFRSLCLSVCNWYLSLSCLNAYFTVFPDIDTFNEELTAIVRLENGNSVLWTYPKQAEMSMSERIIYHRYFLYYFRLLKPKYAHILPEAAAHIAKLVYEESHVRPLSLTLRINWQEVENPITKEKVKVGHTDILQYVVKEQDLK